MTVPVVRAAFGLTVAVLAAAAVSAQGVQTGTLRGLVTGAGGAPVAGVEVVLSSPELQGTQSVVTGATGRYVFTRLPAGAYTVEFRSGGSEIAQRQVQVPLGSETAVDVAVPVAGQTTVDVTAPLLPVPTGSNYTSKEIDALAVGRTISEIARFAPGVSGAVQTPPSTEGQAQFIISGGQAYDNAIMVNGVDVNDNIFGWPQNTFIEDAIAETQILTGGIPAEFGRAGGGVVSVITRSGGNVFAGSYRMNLTNDAWSTETPFEVTRNVARQSNVNYVHEATFGGPLQQDRIWFFVAGRAASLENSPTLLFSGAQYTTADRNFRGEAKMTATVAKGHTVQGSILGNPRRQTNQANFNSPNFATIDPFALSDKDRPNTLVGVSYRGSARDRLLFDAQYSQQQFQTNAGGGTKTNLEESPFLTLDFSKQYNAPYFDANDPDRRNNRQLTGSVAYFPGGHELKVGAEWFRSQKIGGNAQSATGYVLQADYVADANDSPILDADGRVVPLFVPGDAYAIRYDASRGATMNIDVTSVYAQDHWIVSKQWSLDIGVRLEHVNSEATGATQTLSTTRIVPRLGAGYDIGGDGRFVARVTYGKYSSRYSDALFIANSSVGNPNRVDGVYVGPQGQGRGFEPGFNLANYVFEDIFASYPTANVLYDPDLASPLTNEATASLAVDLRRQGSLQVSYIVRRTNEIVEDFIDLTNGTTHVVDDGVDLTLTNRLYANTSEAKRRYEGLMLQGRYDLRSGWSVNGHWTVQFKNDGNYEGEAPSRVVTSAIGDYPEIFTESWHYPSGRLSSFQRHKLHLWSTYALDFGSAGSGSVSGLWRYNSALMYTLRSVRPTITAVQAGILDDLGYPDTPGGQTLFYSLPGSESFAGYGLVDLSGVYQVPIFRSIRPRIELDVFNVFNNQKLISWNTSIAPDPATPTDALGLRTGYVKNPSFGAPTGNTSYPVPFAGQTGGRTFRLAVGVRF